MSTGTSGGMYSEGFTITLKNGETGALASGLLVYISANDTCKICPTSETAANEYDKFTGVSLARTPFAPSVQGTYIDRSYLPESRVPIGVHGVYWVTIENTIVLAAGDYITAGASNAGRAAKWIAGDVTGTPTETTIEAAIAKEHDRFGKVIIGGTGNAAGTVKALVYIFAGGR